MTDVAQHLSDTELIGLAGELSAELKMDSGYKDAPILGTAWDQPVPDGVQNPYWEIVRRMPTYTDWCGAGRAPDGHWVGEPTTVCRRAYDAGLDRSHLCARYSWSIPSPTSVAWIANLTAGRGIVEIGAGSGYWAWQLTQAGVNVVAYDPHPAGEGNEYAKHGTYYPVAVGDQSAAVGCGDRALMLCWPSYCASFAAEALKAYPGDLLIYIGEGWGGCCADDDFFKLLDTEWEEAGKCPSHMSYWGIHCRLSAYKRRPASGGSDD